VSDRAPTVIVRARPLELEQDRPSTLGSLLERAERSDWAIVDVRWALAFEWRLRKMAGRAGEGSMRWLSLSLETIAVRMRRPGAVCYAVWHRVGGGSWSAKGGAVYSDQGVMPLGDRELRHYLSTLELPTHVRARDVQR